MRPTSPSRVFLALFCALLAPAAGVRADEVVVPVSLQAELLFMIAAHDTNLPARAGGEVRVLIAVKPGEQASRAAAQFKAAASSRPRIAGLPHREEVVPFEGAASLAETCKARSAAILYLAPGFTVAEATAVGQALEGGNVLSASAEPMLVRKGVVLGFDLVGGRAKLLVDLTQAAKQRVSFSPEVLGLMAVTK